MDTKKHQQARRMIPYSGGPKLLAFHIRRFRTYGSTSLLIRNRFGVWSAARCRHVKKTWLLRFHQLKDDACEFEKGYVALRKLGANDENVKIWRRRLADFYWDAAPVRYRTGAMDYLRKVKRDIWLIRLSVAFVLAAISHKLLEIVLSPSCPAWLGLGLTVISVVLLCGAGVPAWREACDDADNLVVWLLEEHGRNLRLLLADEGPFCIQW